MPQFMIEISTSRAKSQSIEFKSSLADENVTLLHAVCGADTLRRPVLDQASLTYRCSGFNEICEFAFVL